MENWPTPTIEEAPIQKDEFMDLLALYRDWRAKRSSNMMKLGLRVDGAYSALTRAKRVEFCRVLVAEGELDEVLDGILKSSRGSLERLTYDRINTGTTAGA